jgi:hypothetical protein
MMENFFKGEDFQSDEEKEAVNRSGMGSGSGNIPVQAVTPAKRQG